MSTVDEIRARMAKACSIDYRDTDDDFMESAEGDLEYLLAEHQRMAAVVEAARGLRKHYPLVWRDSALDEFCPICFAYDYEQPSGTPFQHNEDCPIAQLQQALAAYEEGRGDE